MRHTPKDFRTSSSSHGWNNDWTVAVWRYEDFIDGFAGMRRARALPRPAEYKPLLVGIFWPSTALVFTEKEKGPQIAAGQPQAVDQAVAEERLELEELAEALDARQAADLYELTQKTRLTADEARRLARKHPSRDRLLQHQRRRDRARHHRDCRRAA